MRNEKIRVFISSKQSEFEAERAVLAHEIEMIPLLDAVWAEQWSPAGATPVEVYLKDVRSCPIYVGLFGRVYSEHTKLEYLAACENPYREKLLYVKESQDVDAQLQQLIAELQERHTVGRFRNIGDLVQVFSKHLIAALGRMIEALQTLGETKPVAHGSGTSVLEMRFAKRLQYLEGLGLPGDLSAASNQQVIANIERHIQTGARLSQLSGTL
jgi:Domain of unknown function (DUF4062)